MSEKNENTSEKKESLPSFIDVSKFSYEKYQELAKMSESDREAALQKEEKHDFTIEEVTRVEPMTFLEELTAVLIFLFLCPGSVFSIPILACLLAFLTGQYTITFTVFAAITILLTILPAPFQESALSSWWSLQVIRYFSYKGIYEERLKNHKPYILVAPPHGVFPFGNIITMMAFPSLVGFSFRGLAASAAVTLPFFKQFLCTVGAIDASRASATKVLS